MSNWEHANEQELAAARDAYPIDSPKHPEFVGALTEALDDEDYIEANRLVKEHAMTTALVPQHDEIVLFTGNPQERMRQIKETASILAKPVGQFSIRIGQTSRPYVKAEGWTLLGSLLGVHPIVVWTRKLEEGWEARVEARTRQGELVGAAEAECLRSETNWAKRDDYALRSMAQTRATAKALRGPLGFVMALAGYETTPAEEMPASQFQAPRQRDATVDPEIG